MVKIFCAIFLFLAVPALAFAEATIPTADKKGSKEVRS